MNPDLPTLTATVPGLTISVQADRWESDGPNHGRWVFAYRVSCLDCPAPILAGADLRSGTVAEDAPPHLPDALDSLVSFLSAQAEYGRPDSSADAAAAEGYDPDQCEALYMLADELETIGYMFTD